MCHFTPFTLNSLSLVLYAFSIKAANMFDIVAADTRVGPLLKSMNKQFTNGKVSCAQMINLDASDLDTIHSTASAAGEEFDGLK